MISRIFTQRIRWACMTIEVSYEPAWLGLTIGGEPVAHLQLRSLDPDRAALPVSETGYKSHYVSATEVEECGGPVAYAIAWLDHAATFPDWIALQESSRQLALF